MTNIYMKMYEISLVMRELKSTIGCPYIFAIMAKRKKADVRGVDKC